MPTTETLTRSRATTGATRELKAAERSEETQELLDDTDSTLDAIEAVLEEYEDGKPKPKVAYSLADAIRDGCALAPQMIGNFYGPRGETCALSAALAGIKARGLA